MPVARENMAQLHVDLALPHQGADLNSRFAPARSPNKNLHSLNPHLANNHHYRLSSTFLI